MILMQDAGDGFHQVTIEAGCILLGAGHQSEDKAQVVRPIGGANPFDCGLAEAFTRAIGRACVSFRRTQFYSAFFRELVSVERAPHIGPSDSHREGCRTFMRLKRGNYCWRVATLMRGRQAACSHRLGITVDDIAQAEETGPSHRLHKPFINQHSKAALANMDCFMGILDRYGKITNRLSTGICDHSGCSKSEMNFLSAEE
ncbi:hypothetical protein AGR1A_Cc20131 [Agrobacterium fabacearum CFBP 5771]|nr:hypothetical protein AGR1A_Cc20131 [Agrobacterium fabacearum CFBP 5771]